MVHSRLVLGHRPRLGTPHYAVALVALLSFPFVFLGDIRLVAGLVNVVLLVVFVLVNAAMLKRRYAEPDVERGFRAPGNVGRLSLTALAGLFTSVGLIVFYLTTL